jgi:hypothetical protein
MRVATLACLASLAGGCFLQQKLDHGASAGDPQHTLPTPPTGSGGAGPSGTGGAPATPGVMNTPPQVAADGGADPAPTLDCQQISDQARSILRANCAFCHQAPGREGNFDFILDFNTLMKAVGTTGKRFAVPGMPDQSRLFQRAAAGEMPPAGRMPRPGPDDIRVLREWIQSCLVAGPSDGPDAGAPPPGDSGTAPPPGCGGPGQDCCLANSCNAGGCCVLGQCRGEGQACGDGVGQFGLPGTCHAGSCQNAGNVACGNPGQPCCGDTPTCTAPRSTCSGTLTCAACGGDKQICCSSAGVATCLAGLGCLDAGFSRVATCQPCGAVGQRCCGNGPIPQRLCNGGAVCQAAGAADVCSAPSMSTIDGGATRP